MINAPRSHNEHDKVVFKAFRFSEAMKGIGHDFSSSVLEMGSACRPMPRLIFARQVSYPISLRISLKGSSPLPLHRVDTPRLTTVSKEGTSAFMAPSISGTLFSLILLFYLLNFGVSFEKGIIIDPQTYLMTGPSGGADVIGIIEKGHRVEILGTDGVWIKIRWENQEVYVRNSKIKTLS